MGCPQEPAQLHPFLGLQLQTPTFSCHSRILANPTYLLLKEISKFLLEFFHVDLLCRGKSDFQVGCHKSGSQGQDESEGRDLPTSPASAPYSGRLPGLALPALWGVFWTPVCIISLPWQNTLASLHGYPAAQLALHPGLGTGAACGRGAHAGSLSPSPAARTLGENPEAGTGALLAPRVTFVNHATRSKRALVSATPIFPVRAVLHEIHKITAPLSVMCYSRTSLPSFLNLQKRPGRTSTAALVFQVQK